MQAKHQTALQQAIEWITHTYQPIGIIAGGSIIRGNPDANSDFDMYVIHTAPYKQRLQKFFNGVPCEIFVNSPAHVADYLATEKNSNRPVTANIIGTGRVVSGQQHPTVLQLIQQAQAHLNAAAPLSAEKLTAARYSLALKFEDAADVWPHHPATAVYLLNQFVNEAVDYVYLHAQQPLPRIKERLQGLAALDAIAAEYIYTFYTTESPNAKMEQARQLVLHLTGHQGFFEWESGRVE